MTRLALPPSLKELGSPAPSLGLGLMLAWIYAPLLSGGNFYTAFHLSFGCTLLVVAGLYALRSRTSRPPARVPWAVAPWVACALMALSPVTVFFIDRDSAELQLLSGILGGVGASYCFCRWFLAYSALPVKTAVRHTLIAFATSAALRLGLTLLTEASDVATGVIVLAMPPVATWLMGRMSAPQEGVVLMSKTHEVAPESTGAQGAQSAQANAPSGTRAHGAKAGAGFAPILLEIVIYGLVFGFLRTELGGDSGTTYSMVIGHVLRIALPLFLLSWLAARLAGRDGGAERLRWPLTITAIALLAAVFLGGRGDETLSAVVLAVRSLISILIYIRLFEALYRTKLHPCVIYGVGRAAYELALVGGLFCYDQTVVRSALDALPSGVIYFLVASALVLLLGAFSRAATLPFMRSEPVSPGSIGARCEQIAIRFELTEREAQIMQMTCLGRSKKYIADELSLSEDTIRYHTKRYYRKLGIHNRQELLTLIGVE